MDLFVIKQVFNVVNTTYSSYQTAAEDLSAEVPVASSPITARWQQSQAGDVAAPSFGEDVLLNSRALLEMTPEKETLTPGEVIEMPQKPVLKS